MSRSAPIAAVVANVRHSGAVTVAVGMPAATVQPDSGEIYSSTDPNASVWSDLGSIQGFAPRCGSAVFSLQDRIWIVGGGACDYSQVYNEVWSSADGVSWSKSDAPAQWSPRMWPCVAKYGDGTVILVGGYSPTDWNKVDGVTSVRYGVNHADVWYTNSGIDWKQVKADYGSGLSDDGGLEPRHASTCYVVTDGTGVNSLMVMAGSGGGDGNGANAKALNSIRALPLPKVTALQ